MPLKRPTLVPSLVFIVVALFAQATHAQTIRNWIGTSGAPTSYSNAFNWSGGQIPLGTDIALFLNVTANNLTSSGNIGAGQLILTNSTVSFVSANNMSYTSGISLALNNSSLFLRTNSAADATTFRTNIAYLGQLPSLSRSTLTLDEGFGGTVSLTTTSATIVGGGSPATLAVQNGATLATDTLHVAEIIGVGEASQVSVSGTNAQVNVTGQVIIGNFGQGQLNIQSRGVVSANSAVIGQNSTSSGTVNISNTGSQLNLTTGLTVGSGGPGTLNVFTGAVVNSNFGTIGVGSASGTVNIDGAGSRWNLANSLSLGFGGALGVLNLTGGAHLSANSLILQANGRVDVTNSTVTVGTIFSDTIGALNFNSGTFNVTSQDLFLGQTGLLPQIANVSAGRNINIGGTVRILGGTELTLSGGGFTAANLVLESGGQFAATDNRSLTSSLVANNGTVTGPAGASRLTFTGNVLGQGSFLGNTRFDNRYTPGNGSNQAIINLDDAVFGETNTLNLNIGFTDTQADRLTFASLGTFGGTLTLDFAGAYMPRAGHSFDLFDGPTSGAFSTFNFPDVSGLGLMYDTSQLYSTGVVSILSAGMSGDFDNDGDVDGRDFLVWQRGGSPSPLSASDLADWQANYGTGATAGLSSSVVPEPASWVILLCGTVLATRRRAPKNAIRSTPIA